LRLSLLIIAFAFCSVAVSTVAGQIKDSSSDDLIKQLDDKEPERRRDAVYELVRRADYSDSVIAALGKATDDRDTQVRTQSLTGLARAGKKSEPVIPQLIKCLSHRDDQVRYRAAGALGAIGIASIQPLTEAWTEKALIDTKVAIAQAFAVIGPEAVSAAPMLTEAMSNGSGALPRYAAEALVAIAPQDEPAFITMAGIGDAAARKVGIVALAAIASPSEQTLTVLKTAATDAEPKIRETAIVAVAKSRLPMLEKSELIEGALVDPVASVRAAAIVAMRKAEVPAGEFPQRIAARLRTSEGEATNAVVKAIATFGREASGVLPNLLEIINKEGVDQQLVSQTLASFGASVVPELLASIEKQPANEPVLSQALALIGEPAVESLVRGMASDVELVRVAVTRAIGGVRPLRKPLLEKLVTAANDKSAQVRQIAIGALVSAEKEAEFAKDTVRNATDDSEASVRAAAIPGLNVFSYPEEQLQSTLDRGLSDVSPEVRSSAMQTLSEMPKQLHARLDALAKLVADDAADVRLVAVQTLAKLDKKQVNEGIKKACVRGLQDSDLSVRIAATASIKSLGVTDASILDAVAANLTENMDLLRTSLDAISGFGEKASLLIPSVSGLVNHEKAEVRAAALNALSSIDKNPQNLAGRLTDALNDKEWEVRRIAGVALGKLGADAKNAVPKLFQLLNSDEDRDYASSSLREINTAPVEAVPMLIEKLASEERRTAFYAVTLLGKIGPPAAEALPKLEQMLANPTGEASRADFRKKTLIEAIAAIKGESLKEETKK
jgi:HEAT repeat protein